ncbi:MAG: hypothetical protein ABIF77_17700 [bacterium]
MKTRTLLVAACVLLTTASVSAQLDPDPDGFGIYADLGATSAHMTVPVMANFEAYLILTNPTVGGGVFGWSCSIGVPENVVISEWAFNGLHVNAATPPEFCVGLGGAGIPTSNTVLLSTLRGAVLDSGPASFTLGSYVLCTGEFPAYAPGDIRPDFVPMYPSAGWERGAVFTINGAPPVPVDERSWGEVKALYR